MPLPSPVIVVPGIIASELHDEYKLPHEAVWAARTHRHERIALSPLPYLNDLYIEASEPARITPYHPFSDVYEDLIDELRDELSPASDKPVPVYPFGYDWRMPLEQTESHLADFVKEVIARTKLQRHYHDDGFAEHPSVNMIGHSMGGLIIAGYLESYGAKHVNKVVTIATPFKGSIDAIHKMAIGKKQERRTARVTPSVYYLLPSFPNALKVPQEMSDDIFNSEVWQTSVLDTIEEFIPTWEMDNGKNANDVFRSMLTKAEKHRKRISKLQLSQIKLKEKNWLAIVGVDKKTRIGLKVRNDEYSPRFRFDLSNAKNKWKSKKKNERFKTGDGTVPLIAAIPTFLCKNRLVCITPDDFDHFERDTDYFTNEAIGFHGALPRMKMLHRLIARFLTRMSKYNDNTWGRPLPDVSKSEWKPPVHGKLASKKLYW